MYPHCSYRRWNRLAVGLALAAFLACQPAAPPPAAPAPVAVTSETVSSGPFRPFLRLLGTVQPAGLIELRSPGAGRLDYPSRFASGLRTGAEVRRGELLFEVDDPDVRLLLVEHRLAARQAETELERSRRGVEEGFLPSSELDQRQIQAELARERLAAAERAAGRLRLEAPADGILRVDEVREPGAEVSAGVRLAELATRGAPKVEAWASAADLEWLRPGLPVDCLDSRSEKLLARGILSELAGEVDAAGVARLVATLETPDGALRPGIGVLLRVGLAERAEALTVAERALVTQGGVTSVFVLEPRGDGHVARPRLVRIGQRSGERVEVLDGVREGDRIALDGVEYLAEGVAVRDVDAEKEGS